eukprot:15161152-Alexandrium_andersonii.AAC.1
MSASLVGSEMCIRDRRWSAQGQRQSGRRAVYGLLCQAGAPGGRETARAVSYTHLTLPTICSV